MAIKVDPPDEWRAVGAAAVKAVVLKYVPGLDVTLEAYDALEAKRRKKAFESFKEDVLARLDRLEGTSTPEWLGTEDGQIFAGKVLSAALDAQMADKRQLFANALVNGAFSDDLTFLEKTKFVDLLRSLSRVALEALALIQRRFGRLLNTPPGQVQASVFIDRDNLADALSREARIDPYLMSSAIAELESAGLFSRTRWRPDAKGGHTPMTAYDRGSSYTEFAERFVQFIKDPE